MSTSESTDLDETTWSWMVVWSVWKSGCCSCTVTCSWIGGIWIWVEVWVIWVWDEIATCSIGLLIEMLGWEELLLTIDIIISEN